ncbi:MAG: low affinity iron permease family protein [bacterium]
MAPSDVFSRFARWAARLSGHGIAFAAAMLLIAGWAVSGPLFGFSDTWQLTINTATTVVTFLMVFIIQNTQLRDMEALQIKVDEILRASARADNAMLDLENLPEERLERIQEEYARMAHQARRRHGARRRNSKPPV